VLLLPNSNIVGVLDNIYLSRWSHVELTYKVLNSGHGNIFAISVVTNVVLWIAAVVV
jgi:hypothetical protein